MSERPLLLYCQDILDSTSAILSYVQGVTFEDFAHRMRCSAVIREFEIIGEAVGKLPADLKELIRKFLGRTSRISAICSSMNTSGSIWR